jgi:predicted ester cyclase
MVTEGGYRLIAKTGGGFELERDLDRFTAQTLAQAFPDIHFEFEDLVVDGNLAAYTTHLVATHRGDLRLPDGRTLPATGRSFSVLMVSLREVRDGKVVRMVNGWDRLSLLAQLGLAGA